MVADHTFDAEIALPVEYLNDGNGLDAELFRFARDRSHAQGRGAADPLGDDGAVGVKYLFEQAGRHL